MYRFGFGKAETEQQNDSSDDKEHPNGSDDEVERVESYLFGKLFKPSVGDQVGTDTAQKCH